MLEPEMEAFLLRLVPGLEQAWQGATQEEIAEIAEKPVHLFLFVKVRENWGDDPDRYREMGLEFPRE